MTPAERDLRYYAALGLAAEASHLALGYFNRREALGVDVAIISTMHVLRIAIVVLLAPLAFRILGLKPKA